LVVLAFGLAACGNTSEERGITGAGLGAAGGAILGALTGLTVLEGALIGTAAGGITGLLTDKGDFDIGDPFWKTWGHHENVAAGHPAKPAAHQTAAVPTQLVTRTQVGLSRLGYDPGPIDGVYGPVTSAAISEYQYDYGLSVDGKLSEALAKHIRTRVDGGGEGSVE